jgi:hypothetical protein
VFLPFIYEDVSKSVDKHTSAFEFPDVDGTFVQSLGRSGNRLPLRVIFSGDNYDQDAKTFDDMLNEDGVGTLDHPVYGTFRVVPFGKITRTDRVKTLGNQAVFDVTFFETNDILFPLQVESKSQDVQTSVEEFNEAVAPGFVETIVTTTTSLTVSLRDEYAAEKGIIVSGLEAVAAETDAIKNAFDTVNRAIDDAIETFIDDPLTVAFQTTILIQLPARSAALIADRLSAYGNLLTSIVTGNVRVPGVDATPDNAFRSDDMMASNLLIGSVVAVLNTEFTTKGDALAAADVLLAQLDQYTVWHDDNLVSLGLIDTGSVYREVIDTIFIAAGFLVEISFTLLQERSVVLTEPTTPINLEAKFYRTLDENLDFIISSNELVGDLIFEVPAGFAFVYYV